MLTFFSFCQNRFSEAADSIHHYDSLCCNTDPTVGQSANKYQLFLTILYYHNGRKPKYNAFKAP